MENIFKNLIMKTFFRRKPSFWKHEPIVFSENKAEESLSSTGNLSFWPPHQFLLYFFFLFFFTLASSAGYIGTQLKYYHFADNVLNFLAYVRSFKPLRIIHSSTKTWVKYITNFPQRINIFSSCLDSLSKTWPDLSSPSVVLGFYFLPLICSML